MRNNGGWLKLFRKFREWSWYRDGKTKDLFIELLLTANTEDGNFMGVNIKRGQTVTGRKQLAETLGFSEQNIRTSINKLKSTSEITSKIYNKFTVISIINFDKYQGLTNKSTEDQPATNQQLTTNKEYKNIRNKEDINININTPKAGDKFINRILETFRERVGHQPTDLKPRYEAYNLVRRIKKLIKEVGKEDTEEQTNRVIDKYFEWLDKQDWFVNVQNMSVIRRKFEIYQQNVINHLKPNV